MSDVLDGLHPGGSGHPSDLALDRLHHGELEGAPGAALRAHLQGCAACSARMSERERGFAQYPQLDERKLLAGIRRELDEAPKRSLVSRLLPALGLAGALAAAVLVAVLPGLRGREDGTRLKGGLALHVYRFKNGHSEAAVSGESFAAGDRLRFVVDLPSAGYVRIVGAEADGSLFTAWPLDAAAKTQLGPGQAIALEGPVALDDTRGRETLYLVQCPSEIVATTCAKGEQGKPSCPAACALTPFVLEKGP